MCWQAAKVRVGFTRASVLREYPRLSDTMFIKATVLNMHHATTDRFVEGLEKKAT